MRRADHTLLVVFCIFLASLPDMAAGRSSAPSPSQKIDRVEIQRSNVPDTDLEMRVILVTYPPGAAAPVHHHPVVGINYILEGAAETAFDNDAPRTYKAGQSFQDLAMHPHTIFRNASQTEPLKFLIFYTIPKGMPALYVP
jgi:quercetin dioxygenase-like cupin family protein